MRPSELGFRDGDITVFRLILLLSLVLMLWDGEWEWARVNLLFGSAILTPPHPTTRYTLLMLAARC